MSYALKLGTQEQTALLDADAIDHELRALAEAHAGRDRELRAAVAQHLKAVLADSRVEAERLLL